MSDNTIKPSDTFGVIKSTSSSSASEPESKAKAKTATSGGSFLERTLNGAGLDGAAKEANKGITEMAKASERQPTWERRRAVEIYKAAETGAKVAVEGAKDIGSKISEKSKAITEPFAREVKEADKETGEAERKFARGFIDSLNPLDEANVRDKVGDQPTIERKIFWGGVVGAKNVFTDFVDTSKDGGNLVKEYGEGIGETFLHNPFFNAQREAWSAGLDAVDGIGGNAKDGYQSAMKVKGETDDRTEARSEAQAEENSEELADAAGGVVRGFGTLLNPMAGVDDAKGDQPTPERGWVAGGYQLFSNLGSGSRDVTLGSLNVAKEGIEAEFESTVTDVKNLGDEVSSGFQAAGSFASGLFGGD